MRWKPEFVVSDQDLASCVDQPECAAQSCVYCEADQPRFYGRRYAKLDPTLAMYPLVVLCFVLVFAIISTSLRSANFSWASCSLRVIWDIEFANDRLILWRLFRM